MRGSPLLLALLLCAPGRAQLDGPSAKIKMVVGRPMLRCTLQAGEKIYYGHLLLDLAATAPLRLHRNAAGTLRARRADVRSDHLDLKDVPIGNAGRDPYLERFTAEHDRALGELPLIGYLGLSAFDQNTCLIVDLAKGELKVLPAASFPDPATVPGGFVMDFEGEPEQHGVRVAIHLVGKKQGGNASVPAVLYTRQTWLFLDPGRCRRLGLPEQRLLSARIGDAEKGFDVAARTPFRPFKDADYNQRAGIGAAVLAQLRLTIDLKGKRLLLEPAEAEPYPRDEAELYRCFAGSGLEQRLMLETFLQNKDFAESEWRGEAARLLMASCLRAGPTTVEPELLEYACMQRVATAPEDRRGGTAVDLLGRLPKSEELAALRAKLAQKALDYSGKDRDGEARHQLRHELGRLLLDKGQLKQARRHLLAAAFALPRDGPINLSMGTLHEKMDQTERAKARYFLAMLDARKTGVAGFLQFRRLHNKTKGEATLLATLEDLAEGRVPALHPMPRDKEDVQKDSGRTVLCELFTGAHCPPCVAADGAFDALHEYYGDKIVLLQWHLPIPRPEPLVSLASAEHARLIGIRATPTVLFCGRERIAGGGDADAMSEMFRKYTQVVDELLTKPRHATLTAKARRDKGKILLEVTCKAEDKVELGKLRLHAVLCEDVIVYPGRNGMLFHRQVARGRITRPEGERLDKQPVQAQRRLDAIIDELDTTLQRFEQRAEFAIRPIEPSKKLHVVVFLADPSNGSVLEACTCGVE